MTVLRKTAIGLARMVRVLSVDTQAPAPDVLAEAARVLRGGGLVAFPTETVYGLGARAFDERALARVFAAKGRPAHHPLIAHVLGKEDARRLGRTWPAAAEALAGAFWPGPLTLVLDRASRVPAAAAGGGDSIAVRAPSHPVARGLIAALDEPIAAPSANRYQALSPTTAEHVVRQLGDRVDLVLDGGRCEAGIESTVVDVRGVAQALRPGAVSLEALRAVVPEIQRRREFVSHDETRASPGLDSRHYAPRAPLRLADTKSDALHVALDLVSAGARVGLVIRGAENARAEPAAKAEALVLRALPDDPAIYAHHLYATLHELDAEGVSFIIVQRVPGEDAWWAIADRLERAAASPEVEK